MKLAFIGTHGVGKTTLCYDLAAALKRQGVNVDMVKEVARLSPLPINRKTSLDAQTWILTTQVAEEIRSSAHHEVVVCDRSVLDNYAYLSFACGRQKAIERFVDYWMKSYTLLFKVPISGQAAADGVRDTDEFFMRQIDQLVDTLLAEKKIPFERLPEGSRDHLDRHRQGRRPASPGARRAVDLGLPPSRRSGRPGCSRRYGGTGRLGKRHETHGHRGNRRCALGYALLPVLRDEPGPDRDARPVLSRGSGRERVLHVGHVRPAGGGRGSGGVARQRPGPRRRDRSRPDRLPPTRSMVSARRALLGRRGARGLGGAAGCRAPREASRACACRATPSGWRPRTGRTSRATRRVSTASSASIACWLSAPTP